MTGLGITPMVGSGGDLSPYRLAGNVCAVFRSPAAYQATCFRRSASAREHARYSWPAVVDAHVLVHPWDRFELIGVLRESFCRVGRGHGPVCTSRHGRGRFAGAEFLALRADEGKGRCALAAVASGAGTVSMTSVPPSRSTPRRGGASAHGLSAVEGTGTLSRYVELVLEKTALAARLEAIGEPSGRARTPAGVGVAGRVRARHATCVGASVGRCARSNPCRPRRTVGMPCNF